LDCVLEVVKWIREDDGLKTIPIIAVTASAMKGDEPRILAGGCDYYLAKSVKLKRLVAIVERSCVREMLAKKRRDSVALSHS
jgi:two-component system, cell cycle response regulator DivK